jgi:GTP diphosphokinase / guanosine-3',5'-bis(diphosphate) 3'-diphosphatase
MQQIELAKKYCQHYHSGQFRKGSNEEYEQHPFAVAELLANYGYNDSVTQCIAYLHDTVEDTNLITSELSERFGYEIANGVFVLSKNTLSENTTETFNKAINNCQVYDVETLYKIRLSFARRKVKRVKIADMIHNTKDLKNLKPDKIKEKIEDAMQYYIPMGKIVAPLMVEELEKNISVYQASLES